MRNLLSANLLRLRKSGLFWGLLAVMFAVGLLFTFSISAISSGMAPDFT